ncbi:MAG: tetratricopeptide repeat protein [Endomicrobia bacterium]|nr:tetratricopeptide repeat protein [Endomicrobiia bacterium]
MRKKHIARVVSVSILFISASFFAPGKILSQGFVLNYDPNSEAMGNSIASMSKTPISFINSPSSNFSVLSGRLDFAGTTAFEDIYGAVGAYMLPTQYGNFTAAFAYSNLGSADWNVFDFYLNYVYPLSTDIPVYRDKGGLGATIKGYQFKLEDESKMSFAFDFGAHYSLDMIFDGLWGFAALKNLGSDIEFDSHGKFEMPGSFNFALRYDLPFGTKPAFTGDFMKFFSEGTGYSFGFEITPVYPATVKIGWRDYGDNVNWGPTAGLFLNFDSFNIGYSFAAMYEDIKPKHTVNFGFMFGKISDANKAYDYYLGYNYNMAREAYNRKDYISARQQLEDILAIYPEHQPSKELLKQLVYDLDMYDRNLEVQLSRWLRRADLALHRHNLVKAKNYYYRVLGVDPENSAAEDGIAQVNERLKHVEIQENRKKYEKEIIALWAEGMDFYNNGQFIFAKEKFNRILELDPENAGALKYLGIIQTQISKVTDLQADKMFTQGMEYYNMADYDRAARYFNAVYASDPKRTDAKEYYELSRKALNMSVTEIASGSMMSKEGEIKSRLADKDDSSLSSSQKVQKEMEMYFNKSVDLFNKGQYEEALKSFVALRENALRNNYYDLNPQIREYTTKSRNAIAENYFKEALALVKIDNNEEALEKIKKSLEYNKDYNPAVREHERLTSELSQKYYDMGIKAYASGQKPKAKGYLEKSLEYDPKKIESKKALERIKALGD